MSDSAKMLLEGLDGGKWTIDEFRAMDRKDLRKFAAWDGEATVSLPAAYDSIVALKGFNVFDAQLAMQVFTQPEAKSTMHNRPDSFLSTHGGQFVYHPTKVQLVKLSGEKIERSNAPIPAKFGDVDKYENMQAVASFCSQLVKSEKGSWIVTVNPDAMLKVLKASELSVPGLMLVAAKVRTLLSKDRVWTTMPTISRNAISGEEHLCFVREALNRLPVDSYDILNTMIVCSALRTFERKNGRWIVAKKEDGKYVIPKTVYVQRKTDMVTRTQLKTKYPDCYWYLGGLLPSVAFPEATGDLKSTLKNVQRAHEVKGSDSSATTILAQMRGYSGLTDDFGKRIQFVLASVLHVWALGRPANIYLNTVGDIVVLVSSLNYWRREIKNNNHVMFATSEGEEKNPCSYKFILPKITDKTKVNVKFHELIVPKPEKNSVVVMHHLASLPTSEEKGTITDYDKHSENIVPEIFQEGVDFVMYTTVYGACPFSEDVAVRRSVGLTAIKFWNFKPSVFIFGNSARFSAVLSSLRSWSLVGWGYSKLADKVGYDERAMAFQKIALEKIETQSQWYLQVVKDARAQCFSWLSPVTRYSPISNLPYVSKAGVTLTLTQVQAEDGVLLGNVIRSNHEGLNEYQDEFVNDDGAPIDVEEPVIKVKKGVVVVRDVDEDDEFVGDDDDPVQEDSDEKVSGNQDKVEITAEDV